MTPAWWGAVLGGLGACGLLLVTARVAVLRRPQLSVRVLPYVRDLPMASSRLSPSVHTGRFGVVVRPVADVVERVLGGATSVRRRLERADLDRSVHDFRVEQVLWGVVGFAVAAALGLLRMVTGSGPYDFEFFSRQMRALTRDAHSKSQQQET